MPLLQFRNNSQYIDCGPRLNSFHNRYCPPCAKRTRKWQDAGGHTCGCAPHWNLVANLPYLPGCSGCYAGCYTRCHDPSSHYPLLLLQSQLAQLPEQACEYCVGDAAWLWSPEELHHDIWMANSSEPANGLDLPKPSQASWRLTRVTLRTFWESLANMGSLSSILLRIALGIPFWMDPSGKRWGWHGLLHDNGFIHRRQGKSRLGFRQPQGTLPTSANRNKVWEAEGVPSQWSTGMLQSWLEKQKFEDVTLMSQPTKLRGWLFRAKHSTNSFCFAYEKWQWGKH